jgi:hypothetical protein
MPRKRNFPHEATTEPEMRAIPATSAPPPERSGKRRRIEADTLPPPPSSKGGKPSKRPTARPPKRRHSKEHKATRPARGHAAVDEVTADLSKDPRREKD